jgi:hypothetical protein
MRIVTVFTELILVSMVVVFAIMFVAAVDAWWSLPEHLHHTRHVNGNY